MEIFKLDVPHSVLGEGPVWDAGRQCLWWVDIEPGLVHRYTPATAQYRMLPVGDRCSSLVLCTSGNLMLTLKDGFAIMDAGSGAKDYVARVEANLPDNRFNDGKCDPAGRFWAGTMDYKSGITGAGKLYMLNADRSVTVRLSGITCSNGMAWSPDHTVFYYIDTPTREVVAYCYDKVTGNIRDKRVAVSIPAEQGLPDGMTIDREGMLWVALWGGSAVVRYDPYSGKRIAAIELPVSNVTSCTFGGEHLDDLYITTARSGLSAHELSRQPLAGAVFVCKSVGVKGLDAIPFFDTTPQ